MFKQKKYLPLIIAIAIAAGIYIGGSLSFSDNSDRLFTSNSKKDKLNRLIDYIEYEYVDSINTDSIVDVTVNGILKNLDPHSTYIPKNKMARVAENMKGDFVGIGISFYRQNDTITVVRTIENGPSEKAGLKAGDRIIMANNESLLSNRLTPNDSILKKLKGALNTKVILTVYRKGEPDLLQFNVIRDHIPIKSVEAAYPLAPRLGYIKINRFAETTYNEFKTQLNKLQQQNIKGLVLDLRNNPGGFLSIAEEIADEFLEENKLILFTKNKRGTIEKSFATKAGHFETGEIYVLINENSASASEIIAGALQDNDKGVIVGRRSFGKGLVQREMELGDGSAVRLTVSRYYTPTGRSIQRSYKNGNTDYYDEYYNRLTNGELESASKIEVADSLKFTTPKGKIVYGGGGIIPDVFVPIDPLMQNETILLLQNRGIFSNFIFDELEKDRSIFNTITQKDFIENFNISDDMVLKFEDFVITKLRPSNNITFAAYYESIKYYLKANLAEQLFGKSAYFEVINKNDLVILEVINHYKKETQSN